MCVPLKVRNMQAVSRLGLAPGSEVKVCIKESSLVGGLTVFDENGCHRGMPCSTFIINHQEMKSIQDRIRRKHELVCF